ncbi:MAG: NlpC/P60 family protein [Nitrospiraceae bacterium]
MNLPTHNRVILLGVILLTWLVTSCVYQSSGSHQAKNRSSVASDADRVAVPARYPSQSRTAGTKPQAISQGALARTAAHFIGASEIEVRGKRFSFDCSGLTRAIYYSHGVDLYAGVKAERGANGVRLIHRYVRDRGRFRDGRMPRQGDLVFFDNTWDYNGDGRVNDRLTHIGVVEGIEENGTVVFVSRVSRGIERYRMNLSLPDIHRTKKGLVLNDFLRRKRGRDPQGTEYLTAQLFAGFGTLTD